MIVRSHCKLERPGLLLGVLPCLTLNLAVFTWEGTVDIHWVSGHYIFTSMSSNFLVNGSQGCELLLTSILHLSNWGCESKFSFLWFYFIFYYLFWWLLESSFIKVKLFWIIILTYICHIMRSLIFSTVNIAFLYVIFKVINETKEHGWLNCCATNWDIL